MSLKKIQLKGKTYQECSLGPEEFGEDACGNCAFHDEWGCNNGAVKCIPETRPDNLNVYYVEVQNVQ